VCPVALEERRQVHGGNFNHNLPFRRKAYMEQGLESKKPTVIWLKTDDLSTAYEHVVDGDCDCKTCESKKSKIILEQ
jgi:hypothetical protein